MLATACSPLFDAVSRLWRRTVIARQRPGVNVNRLLASGPGSYDPLSNMAHMTGIEVEVEAAGG